MKVPYYNRHYIRNLGPEYSIIPITLIIAMILTILIMLIILILLTVLRRYRFDRELSRPVGRSGKGACLKRSVPLTSSSKRSDSHTHSKKCHSFRVFSMNNMFIV